jgi:hypothetical protein
MALFLTDNKGDNMTATGTPQVTQFKFRSSPEEDAVREFIRRIVTKFDISPEEWLEGIEALRVYIVVKIFPNITMRALEDEEWFCLAKPEKMGDMSLFKEQMVLIERQSVKGSQMWGLTRRGKWVLATGNLCGEPPLHLLLTPSSCEEILTINNMNASEVADCLYDFLSRQMQERRRKIAETEQYFHTAELFTSIAKMKFEAGS